MKRTALALTTSLMLGGSALAADVMVYSPPIEAVPYVYSWTGFHVGGHFGYGSGTDSWTRIQSAGGGGGTPGFVGSHSTSGFLGGIQAGYTHQMDNFVLGVEGDISWAGMNGAFNWVAGGNNPGPRNVTADYRWVGTLAVRGGIAFDRTLLYAKAGGAFANVRYGHMGANNDFAATVTRAGWMVGAGVEHAFIDNWSVKLEYNYMDFGRSRISMANLGAGPSPAIYSARSNMHAIKLGVNYRF